MKIAIPSHNRCKMFKEKTYSLLMKHNFKVEDIYVFVSPECYAEYYVEFHNIINLVEGKNGILNQRNYIIDYFDEGEMVVEMDDDIDDIVHTIKNVKSVSVDNLKEIFEESFKLCPDGLWGMNATLTSNNFFANGKDNLGHHQLSIVNSCLGYYNDKSIKLSVPEKEDFERVILFYLKNKNILKRGQYGIKTKYWTNKGGLQDIYDFDKRKEIQLLSANMIMEKYPNHAYMVKRKNGIVDLRLKKNPIKLI